MTHINVVKEIKKILVDEFDGVGAPLNDISINLAELPEDWEMDSIRNCLIVNGLSDDGNVIMKISDVLMRK